jgi:hypothetical protein
VYDSALDALEATERASIVREWSSYDWAQYCQSIATEIDATSNRQLYHKVAKRTVKSPKTVQRYLTALSLPAVVHPLLQNGPEGTEDQWMSLKNYNEDVRRYDGFSWRVGSRLGRHADEFSATRLIDIATQAVEYTKTERALQFVQRAVESPQTPLRTIHKQVQWAGKYEEYVEVPRVAFKLDSQEKEALMDYCASNQRALRDLVESQLRDFVAQI